MANWLVNDLQRERKGRSLAELPLTGQSLAELVALQDAGTISTPIAKEVFAQLLATGGSPRQIVEARGLEQVADPAQLRPVVEQVVAANPGQAAAYRDGKSALFGFFVGQVMKATQGKANPQRVQELLREVLGG